MSDEENSKCKHPRYTAEVKVMYATVTGINIKQMMLKVNLKCALCKKNYIFKGPTGFSTSSPLVSQDGYELRAPLEYPDDEPDIDDINAVFGDICPFSSGSLH